MTKKKRRSGGWDRRGSDNSSGQGGGRSEGETHPPGGESARTVPQTKPPRRSPHERRLSGSARKAAKERAAKRRRQMVTVGIPVGVVVIVVLAFAVLALTSGSGTEKGTRSAPTGAITVSPGGSRPSPIPKGKTVPSFTAPALGGGTASWKPGQPTVLVIWAAWCPHCQAELPALQQLHTKYPDVNVVSVVSAQGQEPGPSPEELVAQDHITFPVAVDDSAQSLVNAMGVTGFPTIYFVNADGTVFDQLSGEPPELALDLGFQHLQQQV